MANTIKISGVSDELLSLVEKRWKGQHYADRADYVRDLIRRDLVGGAAPTALPSFSEGVRSLFGALHKEIGEKGYSEAEIAKDVEGALREVRAARKPKSSSLAQ